MVVRLLLQKVNSASLLLDNVSQWDSIETGVLMYVSFLKDAQGNTDDAASLEKAVREIFSSKIYFDLTDSNSKSATPLERQAIGLMVIPQASLAGKLKKSIQYHSLVDKSKGEELYKQFVELVRKFKHADSKLVSGTYGNTQGLKIDATFGPMSHTFDI